MVNRELPTAGLVRQILDYDPETGEFRWKKRTPDMFPSGNTSSEAICQAWNKRFAGKSAGCHCDGYLKIKIKNKKYFGHRIAWLFIHGEWPMEDIDHINCIKSDNSLSNLREATRAENSRNRGVNLNNISGYKGVHRRDNGKWHAQITHCRKVYVLGDFSNVEDAAAAYERAAKNMHGKFSRI